MDDIVDEIEITNPEHKRLIDEIQMHIDEIKDNY